MKQNQIRFLAAAAIIAALYCVVTLLAAPIAFGPVQFRISEVFTILPVFSFAAVPGLAVGCFLSNLIAFFLGLNPVGGVDAIFGTAATLLAAILTYFIGQHRSRAVKLVFAPLPPVLFNGLIVGAELTILTMPLSLEAFLPIAGSVALGELVVCYALGVPLMLALMKKDSKGNELYRQFFKY